MIAVRESPAAVLPPGHDLAWWMDQIDEAITTTDPVLANLRITVVHYRLSLALRAILGPDSGANFHTWATWGSKKAGTTIRQEDVPHLRLLAGLAGGGLGLLSGAASGQGGAARRLGALPGVLFGAWGLQELTRQGLDRASRQILGGNITVLDDIGRATARFVSTCAGPPAPEPARLANFLRTLRPGPTRAGGQALLHHAFRHYYQARHAVNLPARHEQMLLANLYAILHEHIRLQPYIAGAMPRPLRRLITRRLLHFAVGRRRMSVSQDVIPLAGGAGPATLGPITQLELREFLRGPGGWGGALDSLQGSRATDWADLADRMHFICALFRSGHSDPSLFLPPYTAAQCAAIAAGRRPSGAL